MLVMHRNAELPDRCVKSNEPANGRKLKRKLTWHHPAVFLALLANLLIYAILASVLSKRATIYIGLSEKWFAKRRRRMLISWLIVLVSCGIFGVAIAMIDQLEDVAPLLMVLAFIGALFSGIYGLIACRLVHPKKMTDEHIWLKGVHPDFLRSLPAWPYG